MSKKRKVHTPEFKAKVSLEAIKGLKTTSELASQYQVHPVQISTWKKQAVESLPEAFKQGKPAIQPLTEQQLTSPLYEEIGRLKKECRYLVKDFGTSLSPKSTRLRDSCYCPGRPASVPLRHTIASSVQAPQHSRNGLTACRMRVHMASAGYGTCGPCATPAIRTRLRLPGTTRLVLRTSMAGSDGAGLAKKKAG